MATEQQTEEIERLREAMRQSIVLMEQTPDASNTFSAWLNLVAATALLRAALDPSTASVPVPSGRG